ncbi:unnamed protein product [Durusdinium trenchii]|uniref:Dolichyl-phosphate-mannose--protein mannosyltransferase n=2 Tax=Durusdinium trenchii TaxID=1381693 RepID=A0ABP0RCS6_9DINO
MGFRCIGERWPGMVWVPYATRREEFSLESDPLNVRASGASLDARQVGKTLPNYLFWPRMMTSKRDIWRTWSVAGIGRRPGTSV